MLDEETTLFGGDQIPLRVVPTRFFPPSKNYSVPSITSLGLEPTDVLLNEIGGMGERAIGGIRGIDDLWNTSYPGFDVRVWRSTADLLVSMRDTWSIAAAALIEINGLVDYSAGTDERLKGALALQRATFLLEACEQYAISLGHQMTNAAIRMCVECDATRRALQTGNSKTRKTTEAIRTNEDSRQSWPFHEFAVKAAPFVDGSRRPAARALLAAARLYEQPAWEAMSSYRNIWFHRVRPDFMTVSKESQAKVSARERSLLLSLRVARHSLRSFALAVDGASPRFQGDRSVRLFARSVSYDPRTMQPIDTSIDQIRRIS